MKQAEHLRILKEYQLKAADSDQMRQQIEHLRNEIKKANDCVSKLYDDKAALRDENQRLREALQNIVNVNRAWGAESAANYCIDTARAALA